MVGTPLRRAFIIGSAIYGNTLVVPIEKIIYKDKGIGKMKKSSILQAIVCVVITSFFATGCVPTERFERQVDLSADMQLGSQLVATTHNGEISLSGIETSQCDLKVKIVGKANTIENAEKLANAVKVSLEPTAKGLKFVIDKPARLPSNEYIEVGFVGTLPNKADLDLTTHNGAMSVKNVTGAAILKTHNGSVSIDDLLGNIKAETHNGKIHANNIAEQTRLVSHNGEIVCMGIAGNLSAETHNGGVNINYTDTAPSICNISLITYNGSISIKTPPNFSGEAEVKTHNGSIHSDLPVVVSGKISKSHLKGKIGDGGGMLKLETHNGSIKIK